MKKKPKLFNKEFQKQQSEKYRYKHIHTGEYCDFSSYVAEYLVLRRAEKFGMEKPAYKFWTKGSKEYWVWLKQKKAALKLAEKFSEKAILDAIKSQEFNKYVLIGLQDGRGWKINPFVIPIIKKYEKLIEKKTEKAKEICKEKSR